jgi:hypothetical protein
MIVARWTGACLPGGDPAACRAALQRNEPARDRRRRHDGQVLPHEADHGADRARIVGQRYRAARREHRLPERHRERGVRLEPGIHLRLGLGATPSRSVTAPPDGAAERAMWDLTCDKIDGLEGGRAADLRGLTVL